MNLKGKEFFDWLVTLRRHFHRYPELSMEEHETSRYVAEILSDLGWKVTTFPDCPGVVGVREGRSPGQALALRADMDALPIQELNEVPYKSTRNGVMHACGHDAHTAILLGVARQVAESGLMREAGGSLKLIFQPAEETLRGARALISRGVLESPRVDRIIALHVGPHIPAGKIGLYEAQAYASADAFTLTFTGMGTHGARPDEGRDPVTAAAYFITALQTIVSRNIKPVRPAVVSIGKINAGTAPNIIPENVVIEGTIRALSPEVREKIIQRIEEMARGILEAFQVLYKFNLKEGTPPVLNDPETALLLRRAAEKALKSENIIEEPPTMGGEDFAYYTQRCPGAIARLGCGNLERGITHPLHSPRFDMDERALVWGVTLFMELLRDYFGIGKT